MALPRMVRIKQHFDAPVVADLPAAVKEELDQIGHGVNHRQRG